MIQPEHFICKLKEHGIDFFTGVPDSLLKSICAYLNDNIDSEHNIITANEGAAVALASGYHLATGKIGVVYLQNSGEGNIINPLASLADRDVYNIPILLLIGWRGRPGVHDEPQHRKQGKITTGLLNILGIDYDILSQDRKVMEGQIANAAKALSNKEIYALVIEKGTFEDYTLKKADSSPLTLSREDAIKTIVSNLGSKDIIVSTTGMISRELFETRTARQEGHEKDFLTVGSMGHASQIALGIALEKQDRRVWCFDGDGALLMHMGSMAIVGNNAKGNFYHVIFNNGAHDSVGGQPTVGLKIDIPTIAKAVGYEYSFSVDNKSDLDNILPKLIDKTVFNGPVLLEIKVKKGNRKDLGRPDTTPIQNKELFMTYIKG